MGILLFFSFFAGVITILAPCIWPLLPIILSSTSSGGRRKPLGITLGVMGMFAVFTLSVSYIEKVIPFDTNVFRWFAAIILLFLGTTLCFPVINAYVEGFFSHFFSRFSSFKKNTNNGFLSGLVTGFSLGVVWTPCSGPIFATIATLAATQKVSISVILVTLFYVTGIGIPLLLFATLGSNLFQRVKSIKKYLGVIQKVFGVIVLLAAFGIMTNLDKTVYASFLNLLPSYSNALTSIEQNKEVQKQLTLLKGQQSSLNKSQYRNAPDFIGATKWLNTENPIHISDLKGKVILVDFWTYTCINCIRTLPHLTAWYETYKSDGFVVIGIHTPEFDFEKNTQNVANALKQFGITYPIAQDNNYNIWNSYKNEYWPAEYLIDKNGMIRDTSFGEGSYDKTESLIKQLLKETGKTVPQKSTNIQDQTPKNQMTPETYVNGERGQAIVSGIPIMDGMQLFNIPQETTLNEYSLGGKWDIEPQFIIPYEGSQLRLHFSASKVFLVMTPLSSPSTIDILADGNPVQKAIEGSDVKESKIKLDTPRLYDLLDFNGSLEEHTVQLTFHDSQVRVFVFTFG